MPCRALSRSRSPSAIMKLLATTVTTLALLSNVVLGLPSHALSIMDKAKLEAVKTLAPSEEQVKTIAPSEEQPHGNDSTAARLEIATKKEAEKLEEPPEEDEDEEQAHELFWFHRHRPDFSKRKFAGQCCFWWSNTNSNACACMCPHDNQYTAPWKCGTSRVCRGEATPESNARKKPFWGCAAGSGHYY